MTERDCRLIGHHIVALSAGMDIKHKRIDIADNGDEI
jgi:hypothetical protein